MYADKLRLELKQLEFMNQIRNLIWKGMKINAKMNAIFVKKNLRIPEYMITILIMYTKSLYVITVENNDKNQITQGIRKLHTIQK